MTALKKRNQVKQEQKYKIALTGIMKNNEKPGRKMSKKKSKQLKQKLANNKIKK